MDVDLFCRCLEAICQAARLVSLQICGSMRFEGSLVTDGQTLLQSWRHVALHLRGRGLMHYEVCQPVTAPKSAGASLIFSSIRHVYR